MNCSPSFPPNIGEQLELNLLGSGAAGVAILPLDAPAPPSLRRCYESWLAAGCHDTMGYMARNLELRLDPRGLLEGARSVVVCVWPYLRPGELPGIARYARGDDYHDVIRSRSAAACRLIEQAGGAARVCVDSAPVAERYLAVSAGLGTTGLNGLLYVRGAGSWVLISEIFTTLPLERRQAVFAPGYRDAAVPQCDRCGACLRACPGHALRGDGTLDARRCVACLTVEHRGELPPSTTLPGQLFGCDCCQQACHLNRDIHPAGLPEFDIREGLRQITPSALSGMEGAVFNALTRGNAMRRAGLTMLRRNAAAQSNDTNVSGSSELTDGNS